MDDFVDYVYLDKDVHALTCPICLNVARDPQQHDKCGKTFCKNCLEHMDKDLAPIAVKDQTILMIFEVSN